MLHSRVDKGFCVEYFEIAHRDSVDRLLHCLGHLEAVEVLKAIVIRNYIMIG